MWDFITKLLPNFLDFARSSKRNKEEIRELNERLEGLIDFVNDLAARQKEADARQDKAEARHDLEQQNLILRLENILLRHGVTLPPLSPLASDLESDK